jgi:hypothetical protein
MLLRITQISLLAIGLATLQIAPARSAEGVDSYPFQGDQNFRTDGVVTMVDPDRDRVTITAPDGRHYNLDTSDTHIKLLLTDEPGDTGDLVVGMHIRVSGRLLGTDVVAADQINVQPYTGASPPQAPQPPEEPAATVPPPASPAPAPSVDTGRHIELRGTVESVDDDLGLLVVHVRDHSRTVYVDNHTDLTAVPSPDDSHIGVHSGDRVTVQGTLRGDGGVTAAAISLTRGQAVAKAPPFARYAGDEHHLVGRVSRESDKYSTRDIKVRLDPGHDVTVHVPHDVQVLRGGRPISVHELTVEDVVRVVGSYDGSDFVATRIDVLQTYSDEE